MTSELQQKLNYVSAHRENRQKASQFILNNSHFFEELLIISFNINDKNSHKACWVSEFVDYQKLGIFHP